MSRGVKKPAGRGKGRGRAAGRGRSDDPAAKAKLRAAREARREEKRREATARRAAEAEEQARRRAAWSRPRAAVEPPVYEEGEGPHRAGWVAIVGRPNVGKSTLLNALLGQKIAATTHKPQTTRKNLLGVLNPPGAQLLLLDTPGHHQAKGPLNRYMVTQAEGAVREADAVVFVLEARADGKITPGNDRLLTMLEMSDTPVVVALNKVDLVKHKTGMLEHIAAVRERLGERLRGLVPISARDGGGLEALVRETALALPEQDALLPRDEVTDQGERDIVAEFVREKAMLELQDELPYSVAVTIDRFEDLRPKLVRVMATLHVERASQKGIVIGKGGRRLKAIGARARKDIEFLLTAQVYLELAVRVTGDWSNDRRRLIELGYVKKPSGSEGPSKDELAEAIAQLPPEVLAALDAEDDELESDDVEPAELEDDVEGEA